jgi:8-oxo-dGTP pyrophosphatase MutT (NUDIX family)
LREAEEEAGIIFDKDVFISIGKYPASYTLFNGSYINNEWVSLYVLFTGKHISEFIPQPSEVDHFIKLPLRELAEWIATEKEDCIRGTESFEMLENYLKENNYYKS